MTSSVPAVQKAADELAQSVQRGVHLSAISDVAAFSALGLSTPFDYGLLTGLPALINFVGGGGLASFDTGAGYAALSGLNSYANGDISNIDAFSNGGDILSSDAFSALPVFGDIADAINAGDGTALATALGGYSATDAANTFFGAGPTGADGATPVGAVFGTGGIDALAPHTEDDGSLTGGYQALSALPVFFGSNNPNTNFGPGVFNPAGGVKALANYDALSAIPAYLNLPANDAPPLPDPDDSLRVQSKVESPVQSKVETQVPVKTNQEVQSAGAIAPAVTPSTPTDPAAGSTPPASSSGSSSNNRSSQSYSGVFKPNNGVPILFGSGKGNGADNGIRGWGDMLKKAGLNGGETAGGGAAGGAPAGGGAAGGAGGAGGGE